MRRRLVPIVILLIVAAAFAWWWNRPERVIARRVASLFEAANIPGDMSPIGRGTRGEALVPFLAKKISFKGPNAASLGDEDEPKTREEVSSLYSWVATACRSATVQDLKVEDVTVSGDEATVNATIDALIEMPNQERPVDGIQHLEMTWAKEEGKWKMSGAKWRETPRN